MNIQHGTCPECGSEEIYVRKGWFNNVITYFQPPRTQIYVCGICGYVAEFIEGKHLEYVRDKWERYQPPPGKPSRHDTSEDEHDESDS
jgi:predicted RNA-binding Zn-ribbon protein involved in translation (DUF1610 family)